MYYLAFGMAYSLMRSHFAERPCRLTVGTHLHVGWHPRECGTLCAHLPVREYLIFKASPPGC